MSEEERVGNAPADQAEAQRDEVLTLEAERELLHKLRRDFEADYEADRGNRTRAEYWERYSLGGKFQWESDHDAQQAPDAATDKTDLTINLIPQFRNQIVSDQRRNRKALKARPKDNRATRDGANVFGGIIRDIEHESHASWAYDWALEQAVDGGVGYIWVTPVYVDDESLNQELRVEWVPSRFDVVWDKNSRLPWGSDACRAFRTGWEYADDLAELGGVSAEAAKAAESAWPQGWGAVSEWEKKDGSRRQVRVCSAWWLEERMVTIDGVTRRAVKPELKWCRMTGRKIIEGPRTLPGHSIPGVRVVGNMKLLREGMYFYGLPEMVGPQQNFFNWNVNDLAMRLAMRPLASVRAPEGSLGDNSEHEGEWIDAASGKPKGVLYYKPTALDDGTMGPPPEIMPFPEVPAGHVALLQMAEHWLRAGTGQYEASLGQGNGPEQSGVALLQRRKEGDSATFHYHDNMTYAMRRLGEILVELIPHYYDWQETTRILNEDGKEEFRRLASPGELKDVSGNPVAMRVRGDGTDKKEVEYDLSQGRYGVVVDTGPSHATQREEALEFIGAVMPLLKEHSLLGMDKFLRNADIEGAEELAERFHALALQVYPFVADLEEAGPEGPSDKQKLINAQAQNSMLQQQLEQLMPELQRLQMEVQDKQMGHRVKLFEAQMRQEVAQLQASQRIMSDMLEAEGTIEVEKIRAAVKEGAERMKAIMSIIEGSMQPAQVPRLPGGMAGGGGMGGMGPGPAGGMMQRPQGGMMQGMPGAGPHYGPDGE